MTPQHEAVSRAYHGLRGLGVTVEYEWSFNEGTIVVGETLFRFVPQGELYLKMYRDGVHFKDVFCGNQATATLDVMEELLREDSLRSK